MEEPKVVLMHGFTQDEAVAIMREVKRINENPKDIAFAMTTANNKDWTINHLIGELTEEGKYFKTNGVPKD